MSWLIYVLLGALFAGLTTILAKLGMANVNSNLAVAIRTPVIFVMAWLIVYSQKLHQQLPSLTKTDYLILIVSGITTGLSWLFYFKALQTGQASKVGPLDKVSLVITVVLASIILKEKVTTATVIGTLLMTAGTVIIALFP
jgi:transporter family protein